MCGTGLPLEDSEGVSELVDGAMHTLGGLFAAPVFAAPLGIVLGVALVYFSRFSATLVTAQDPAMGLIKAMLMLFVRMAVVISSLLAYFVWARDGFLAFALCLVLSFIGALGFEAFRAASLSSVSSSG